MALTNWTGISPRNSRHRFLDEFFTPQYRRLLGRNRIDDDMMTVPAANVSNTDKSYNLHLAVPGMKKEDFDVNINNGMLYISAENELQSDDSEEGYSFREFSYHTFERSFALPDDVDEDQIKATYQDGILKIEMPRRAIAQPEDTRRSISVK